jgi:hypothetical protein
MILEKNACILHHLVSVSFLLTIGNQWSKANHSPIRMGKRHSKGAHMDTDTHGERVTVCLATVPNAHRVPLLRSCIYMLLDKCSLRIPKRHMRLRMHTSLKIA